MFPNLDVARRATVDGVGQQLVQLVEVAPGARLGVWFQQGSQQRGLCDDEVPMRHREGSCVAGCLARAAAKSARRLRGRLRVTMGQRSVQRWMVIN